MKGHIEPAHCITNSPVLELCGATVVEGTRPVVAETQKGLESPRWLLFGLSKTYSLEVYRFLFSVPSLAPLRC